MELIVDHRADALFEFVAVRLVDGLRIDACELERVLAEQHLESRGQPDELRQIRTRSDEDEVAMVDDMAETLDEVTRGEARGRI